MSTLRHPMRSVGPDPNRPAVLQPRPVQTAAGLSAGEPELRASLDACYAEAAAEPPLREELERHAAQLSDYLQRRQEELDRRAEQLQTQEDALQEQLQSARAWISDRDRQLDERESVLDIRAKAVATREKSRSEHAAAVQTRITSGEKITPSRRSTKTPGAAGRIDCLNEPTKPHFLELEKLKESLRRREVQMEQRLAGVRGQEAELARRTEQVDKRFAETVVAEQRIAERQREIQLAIKRFERLGTAARAVRTY